MKRILVATDGSDGADRAVDFAAQWSKLYGADLLIVSVSGGYGLPERIFEKFTQPQQLWLQELLESQAADVLTAARDRARNVGVTMIQLDSRSGDVASTIIEIAREKQANAIVAGKRGAGRVASLLLGSVSQKLVSLAPLPVAIVP